jgi:hypothetical protein
MQYKTNQLDKEVLFSFENYKNITQDFWVYKFITTNPSYQYSLIDDIKQDLPNVKAVVYLQGKAFYALFEKSKFKNEFELDNQIKKITDNSEEIKPTLITNLRDENEIDKRHLAQLLFNSLANTSNTENAKHSNITGGLYWKVEVINSKEDKENIDKQRVAWQYITLKLELDYHLYLKLEVKTFSNLLMTGKMNFGSRKTKFSDYVQYEILPDNINSMRRLKSSQYNQKPETTYIIAQVDNKKSTVSFLDFSNYENFASSKSGVLYEFLKEVKTQLNKYINVKFIELPFNNEKTEFDKQLSETVKLKIQNFYRGKPIVINIAKSLETDEKAIKLAKDLQFFLTDKDRDYKVSNVSLGDLQKGAINIRIIRNKDFYDGQNDEYCKDENFLVHHITTDDFEKENKITKRRTIEKSAVDVILKESYIKNDIMNGKITILDWTFGEWIFMDRKDTTFRALKVSSNGNLSFENCLENQAFKNENYEKYKTTFQQFDKFNGREFLNCLLVSNNQDVNLIFETPRFTIQEIETIGETLELESQYIEISKEQYISLFEKFLQQNKPFEKDDKFSKIIEKAKKGNLIITKDDLNSFFYNNEEIKKLKYSLKEAEKANNQKEILRFQKEIEDFELRSLSNKTKIKKEFCKFYYENSEYILDKKDVLWHFFKGEDQIEELFASKTNIFYQINNDTEAFYFVGVVPKQIQTDFTNATNIRKIKAVKNLQGQQSKLVFDQLLETMAVDFVKQGNLTVVPFPFKYLRESRQ